MPKTSICIEMPKNCEDCPCAYFTEGVHYDCCDLAKYLDDKCEYGMYKIEDFDKSVPDWCPLLKNIKKGDKIK